MSFHAFALSNKPKPYIVAHRGNLVACPENTLAAFECALADGTDILETGLHLTRDGVFVCIHHASVDRTTDGHGAAADMTLAELKRLSAFYGRPEFKDERVPTLAEAASLIPSEVVLALELKTDRFLERDVCKKLVDELDEAGIRSRTVMLSFHLPRTLAVQAAAPDIPIGHTTLSNPLPFADAQLLGPFWPLLLLNPFYTPLDPTPDSRLWLYRLLGCDAILTDDPAATMRAMGRRKRLCQI